MKNWPSTGRFSDFFHTIYSKKKSPEKHPKLLFLEILFIKKTLGKMLSAELNLVNFGGLT